MSATTSKATPGRRRSVRTQVSAGRAESYAYGSLGRSKRLLMAALRVWELKNGIQDHAWTRGGSDYADG